MKERERPVITASCPDCNATFMGCILDEQTFEDDSEGEENIAKELVKYAKQGYKIEVVEAGEFQFGKCICSLPEIKINEGAVLIAIDVCKMEDDSGHALVLEKEYPVLKVDEDGKQFSVETLSFPNHFFSTERGDPAHWQHFFKLKE